MERNQAIERAMLILDAYLNRSLPGELAAEIRAWFLAEHHEREKLVAMYRLWKKEARLDHEPDEEVLRSFERLAERLNLPRPGDEGFKTLAGHVRRTQWRDEKDDLIDPLAADSLPDVPQNGRAESGPAAQRKGPTLSLRRKVTMRVAAAVALFVVLGGGAWLYLSHLQGIEPPPVAMVTMAVPDTLGAQGRTELADGSDVFIRPGSRISFAKDFSAGQKRLVVMSGEVYFEVAKDSLRPFVVEAGDLKVNVLGTRFNVVASPDDAQTLVTLYEGKVEVAGITGQQGHTVIDIAPGQRLVYDNATGKYRIEQIAAAIPDWIAQRLTFRDTPLGEVFRTIEWYWGVKVVPDGRLDLNTAYNLRFRGREDIHTAMTVVENVMLNFTFTVEGDTVTVTAKNG